MRRISILKHTLLIVGTALITLACEDELKEQPNNQILVNRLEDFSRMLEPRFGFPHDDILSRSIAMSDFYYWTDEDFAYFNGNTVAGGISNVNAHLWEDILYPEGTVPEDYEAVYRTIYEMNYILELVEDAPAINSNNEYLRPQVMGEALAFRAYSFFLLVNNYALHYHPETADSDPGIQMPLVNSNQRLPRSSVEQVYEQIIADLELAINLLENDLPENFFQSYANAKASKAGLYGLLSRVYLYMATDGSQESMDYLVRAKESANACLAIYNGLFDLPAGESMGSEISNNKEILWYKRARWIGEGLLYSGSHPGNFAKLNPDVSAAIDTSDLRFTGGHRYTAFGDSIISFRSAMAGIHVPEVMLNKAEAEARLGELDEAIASVNYLRKHRFASGSAYALDADGKDRDQVIADVLNEKRLEFGCSITRWWDQKRLILLGEYDQTIVRQGVSLEPGSVKYLLEFPQYIKNFNSGLTNR